MNPFYLKKTTLMLVCSLAAGTFANAANQADSKNSDPEFLKKSALMVDQHVANLYRSKKLAVPEVVDDPIFLRRSFLVAGGRIPNLDEARAFLETDQDGKRGALVRYLMNSDGYRSSMTNWVFDTLRMQEHLVESTFAPSLEPYIKHVYDSVAENKPWNQFTKELIGATGPIWENGAVGYYLRDRGMELDNLSNSMRIFTGTRMECAQCHDDPFGEYERMDFYHLAAFTSKQENKNKRLPVS